MPFTPSTASTVKPFSSTNVTLPVVVAMASLVTFVVVSVTFTVPPALIAKSAATIPPAVPVTVDAVLR